ncbi:hypothetical protein B5S31_g3390 [[Candida] boidinii]|nr:hypothetical protein B5S31_g3390 [[Candida] boidinii]
MRKISHIVPRRSKCVNFIGVISLIYFLIYYIFISSSNDNSIFIFKNGNFKNFDKIDKIVNSNDLKSNSPSDYKKYWKFLKNNENLNRILINPEEYYNSRLNSFIFDPRITYSVYLSHIRKLFTSKNQLNEYNKLNNMKIPFAWSDFIDLSKLNPYLGYKEGEKPSCLDILSFGVDFSSTKKKKKVTSLTQTKSTKNNYNSYSCCLDDDMFLEYGLSANSTNKLLTGFNFKSRCRKKTFREKLIHSKSYINSFLPIPNSVIFLTSSGSYEVLTSNDESMIYSGLYNEYVQDFTEETNNKKIMFDPKYQLNKLTDNVPITRPDLFFNDILRKNHYLEIDQDDFEFNFKDYKEKLNSEKILNSLSIKENSYLNSLETSFSIEPESIPKYFYEVNIKYPDKYKNHRLKENGAHYDWRFFNGFLTEDAINKYDEPEEKRRIILHRLLHAWLNFTYKRGIVSWMSHGYLLSWYWNSLCFPWDNDIDVQMSVKTLHEFSLKYNNTLIIDDLDNGGFGKYYIDCSTYISHRSKGNGNNNIDARFIDVDTGMYIDITGLSFSESIQQKSSVPKGILNKYKEEIDEYLLNRTDVKNIGTIPETKIEKEDENKNKAIDAESRDDEPEDPYKYYSESGKNELAKLAPALPIRGRASNSKFNVLDIPASVAYKINKDMNHVNCKNNHFYNIKDITPLLFSMMENSPCLIPKEYKKILSTEYKRGLVTKKFNKFIFVDDLQIWLSYDSLKDMIAKKLGLNLGGNSGGGGSRGGGAGLKSNPRRLPSYGKRLIETNIQKIVNSGDESKEFITAVLGDKDILKEYYQTKKYTDIHKREMSLLNEISDTTDSDTLEEKKKEYFKLLESFYDGSISVIDIETDQRDKDLKMFTPIRKDYWKYLSEVDALTNMW